MARTQWNGENSVQARGTVPGGPSTGAQVCTDFFVGSIGPEAIVNPKGFKKAVAVTVGWRDMGRSVGSSTDTEVSFISIVTAGLQVPDVEGLGLNPTQQVEDPAVLQPTWSSRNRRVTRCDTIAHFVT